MSLLLDTHLKPSEEFFIPNYHFYQTGLFPGRKGGTAVAVREDIPQTHVDLPPFVSIATTMVCEKVSLYSA
jgi:hypothetical protein